MKTILQCWNFMRSLRLVLGIIILIQGISVGDTLTIILGLLFAGMAIANIGCCGAAGCAINYGDSTKKQIKEVKNEEVDPIK